VLNMPGWRRTSPLPSPPVPVFGVGFGAALPGDPVLVSMVAGVMLTSR
jgi:hypothetical protein